MTTPHNAMAAVTSAWLTSVLLIGLQAPSAVFADSNVETVFSNPVDAPTLHAALTTGASADDDAQYWRCAVGDGKLVLHYRLLADGSGVESAEANPAIVSTFTWKANSADAATTTVDGSGQRNELSSIRFADRNSMSLLVAGSVPMSCLRQGEKRGISDESAEPEGRDAVSSSGEPYRGSTAAAVVAEQNRPIASYTYLDQSFSGFPATLRFTAEVAYRFANGYTVYCSNWDPRELDPTPDSVGQAIDGCEVNKSKPKGSLNKPFKAGQTLDIAFGNVSASGFDFGGSSSSRLSGSNLRMTRDGQIAIGKYNAFSVASGGNGAGGGNRKKALVGTYALDGHLITIVTDDGEEHVGFASWESDEGSNVIGHIYINGEHFWNRDD